MSKRNKISFQTVNAGKVTEVDGERLSESSRRIKNAMTIVVRQYKKKEALSIIDARRLVLNA